MNGLLAPMAVVIMALPPIVVVIMVVLVPCIADASYAGIFFDVSK